MKATYCLRCNTLMGQEASHYGQHLRCFEQIFKVSGPLEFHSLARTAHSQEKDVGELALNPHLSSYFGGNYKKYEGRLGASSYILKFSKAEYPELAAVEFLCNKLAYQCGLTVPVPFTLIAFSETDLAFVSKNFMDSQRSHAVLTHIYHYLKPGPTYYLVEEISRTIFEKTGQVSDMEQFFRMLLFDAIIGNHDRHGRNLAFIERAQTKRLAPIYDNPSALGLESGTFLKADFSPRGKIWTAHSQEPEMTDYLEEMNRLGVRHLAVEFYRTLHFSKIIEEIRVAHSLSADMRAALEKLITKRFKDLERYVTHL